MSDQGYTLAETLVAIAILALSIGGLSWGIQVIGRWQAATSSVTADVQASRAAQAALDRALAAAGPFRSDKSGEFTGDGAGFRFDCQQASPCAVSLESAPQGPGLQMDDGHSGIRRFALRGAAAAHFVYRSRTVQLPTWPPAPGARQVLGSVALVADDEVGGAPLLEAHAWRQQPGACAFDVVLQDCR